MLYAGHFDIYGVVTTYPMMGGQKGKIDEPMEHLPKRKTRGSRQQRLFKENVRKPKRRPADFENKGSGVVYTWERY